MSSLCPVCCCGIASADEHGSETRARMAQLWNLKAQRWSRESKSSGLGQERLLQGLSMGVHYSELCSQPLLLFASYT